VVHISINDFLMLASRIVTMQGLFKHGRIKVKGNIADAVMFISELVFPPDIVEYFPLNETDLLPFISSH